MGGLAGGVTLAVLDFVVNGLIMKNQNAAALQALNPTLATYAAIQPRFGAGPATAVRAGVVVWLSALLQYLAMTFMGMWAWSYFVTGAISFLVLTIVASIAGAMLYTEAA